MEAAVLTTREKVSIAWYWQDNRAAVWRIGYGRKIREAEEDLLRSKKSGSSAEQWFRSKEIPLLDKEQVDVRLSKLHYSFAAVSLRNTIRTECS